MKDLLIGNPQKRFYYNVYFGSLPTVGLAETATLIKLKVGNSKKFTNEKIIISACILSLITIACDRENSSSTLLEENINKNNIKNASLKEQLIYKKFYLQQVPKIIQKLGITSEELLALARNSEKNGQQTNTFILQDVIAYAKSKNKTIDNALSQKIEDVQKAFYGLDDTNYNISIYVPFLNEQSNKSSTEDIYIFDDTEDSEQEYFEGYVLNEDGNYVT